MPNSLSNRYHLRYLPQLLPALLPHFAEHIVLTTRVATVFHVVVSLI